MIAGL